MSHNTAAARAQVARIPPLSPSAFLVHLLSLQVVDLRNKAASHHGMPIAGCGLSEIDLTDLISKVVTTRLTKFVKNEVVVDKIYAEYLYRSFLAGFCVVRLVKRNRELTKGDGLVPTLQLECSAFCCPFCSYADKSAKDLRNHLRTHQKDEKFASLPQFLIDEVAKSFVTCPIPSCTLHTTLMGDEKLKKHMNLKHQGVSYVGMYSLALSRVVLVDLVLLQCLNFSGLILH